MKNIISILMFFACTYSSTNVFAQQEIQLSNVEILNLGDGRLFCRERGTEKAVTGKTRLIDGYNTQYIDAEFKDGIATGAWKTFKNNKLIEEANYKDGVPDGERKYYYSDGTSVKEIRHYTAGKANGEIVKYYTNSKVESKKEFKNGVEDGIDILYDQEGNVRSETHYKDGKPDGKSVRNISSNAGDYMLTANYKNGTYNGEYSEIFINGNVKEKGNYVAGKKEGVWEYAKKTGQKIRTDEYVKNDKVKETIYYTDGTVEVVRELKQGKKNGYERKYAYGEGTLKSEVYYQDGEVATAPAGKK